MKIGLWILFAVLFVAAALLFYFWTKPSSVVELRQDVVKVSASVPFAAEPNPQLIEPVDFGQRLEKAQASLPTLDKVRALPSEEKHGTPKALIEAGAEIGDIAEAIEKNPTLAPQGMEFYGKCVKRNDLATAVRAVCLSGLRALAKQSGIAADETGVPPNVSKLTAKLME